MDANSIRNFVADKLDESSAWRSLKAQDFPDDQRNATSAIALAAAAARVRGLQVDPPDPDLPEGMQNILHLARALDCSDPWAEMPWGTEASTMAGRYGFGAVSVPSGGVPVHETVDTIDPFLSALYEAMLDDLESYADDDELVLSPALAGLLGADRVDDDGDGVAARELRLIVRHLIEDRRRDDLTRKVAHLDRIGQLVAAVRDTAIAEVALDDSIQSGPRGVSRFPNTRKQLELAVGAYAAVTGRQLDACFDLAAGSTMTHLGRVRGKATEALDELVRELNSPLVSRDAAA